MSYSYNGQQYLRSFSNGRINSITSGALNYTYSYDAGDNILSWSAGTDINLYTYDKYKIKSKTSGALSYNYTYNSANNRISAKTPSYSTIENLNHTGDKLTSITQSGFSAINYVYDTRGNPTSIAGVNYVYNLKNKLIQIYDANNSMAYEYNGLGERISKQMNGADKTQYVYNNKKLIGEYTANGYVDYIYIGDLLVAINKDNSIFYVHNDHLNTPRKVTNTHNVVVFDWPAVDPFGANQPTINTIGFNIRYPGQYYDTETAYHYNYHRYYNPKTGKYLQADPIGLDGGYNLYNYVDNNSLIGVDPEGLATSIIVVESGPIVGIGHMALNINGNIYDLNPTYVDLNNGFISSAVLHQNPTLDKFLSYKNYKNDYIYSYTINISNEEEKNLQSYLEHYKPEKYSGIPINYDNCVTYTYSSLNKFWVSDFHLNPLPSVARKQLDLLSIFRKDLIIEKKQLK